MKTPTRLFAIALAGILGLGAAGARAAVEVSAAFSISVTADFYAPLTPHGVWIEAGPYGRCWRPAHVAVGWRPYAYGHWVWTDVGWYWVSDEPWAWACYHYGAWVADAEYGWIWVPGIEWAPAWVSWRVGTRYIGWAPLPPRGVVAFRPMRPVPAFAFVEVVHFQRPHHPSSLIVNNTTIVNQTTVINNMRAETRTVGGGSRKIMINNGPGLEPVQKATGKKVAVVSVQDAIHKTPIPESVRSKHGQTKEAQPSRPGAQTEKKRPADQPPAAQQPTEQRPSPKQEKPKKEPPQRVAPPSVPQPPTPAPPFSPPPPNGKERKHEPRVVPPPSPQPPSGAPPEDSPRKGKGHGKDRKGRPD